MKELHGRDYTESLIYTKTTFNKEIYSQPLLKEDIEDRINDIYLLYHSSLKDEINRTLKRKNKVYLFDLHSFYAQSTADVVLGTQEGENCSQSLLETVYNAFVSENFSVKVDEKGLRGGYIVSQYSTMDAVEAIQIELRYTEYIKKRFFGEEEVTNKDDTLFNHTRERLKRVFEKIKNELNKEDSYK